MWTMKLGRPPTAPKLPIAMIGISARPVRSSPSMLHETIAVREAVHGPSPPRRSRLGAAGFGGTSAAFGFAGRSVSLIEGTAATTATKHRGSCDPERHFTVQLRCNAARQRAAIPILHRLLDHLVGDGEPLHSNRFSFVSESLPCLSSAFCALRRETIMALSEAKKPTAAAKTSRPVTLRAFSV